MKGQDIINMLSQGIDMISQKLGVAADKIYPILLKQAQYQLIMYIITITICSIILIIASIFVFNGIKGILNKKGIVYNSAVGEGILVTFYFMISGIVMGITTIVILLTLPEIIQILMNPQWFIWTNYIQPLISK